MLSASLTASDLVFPYFSQGIDLRAGGRTKNHARKGQTTKNVYVQLLVKLYRFLARRTSSKFNKVILKRLRMSRTNRPVVSMNLINRYASKADANQIVVVVGTVTDDIRIAAPKVNLCALRVTDTVRARILAAGGKVLTFDQLAVQRPTGANTLLLRGRRTARVANKYFGRPGTKDSTARPKIGAPGRKTEVGRGRRASRGFKA